MIKEIVEKLDDILKSTAILFGSYAKGIQKEDSDLDIFIVGKHDEDEIKEIGHKYGVEINIKSYPKELFEKEINEDILLKEVAESHIIIKDTEEFVRRIAKWIR